MKNDFGARKFPILIATDVAVRGIGVDGVKQSSILICPPKTSITCTVSDEPGAQARRELLAGAFRESVRMDEILKYMIAKPLPLHFGDVLQK